MAGELGSLVGMTAGGFGSGAGGSGCVFGANIPPMNVISLTVAGWRLDDGLRHARDGQRVGL